jgi:sugar phosphate isomerase/epimerase
LQYVPDEKIDLCFIDTSHAYVQTVNEYEHYKKYCKYIAFHDIDGSDFPDMKRFWKEIKAKHNHWEFTQQYSVKESMGIGVIQV